MGCRNEEATVLGSLRGDAAEERPWKPTVTIGERVLTRIDEADG